MLEGLGPALVVVVMMEWCPVPERQCCLLEALAVALQVSLPPGLVELVFPLELEFLLERAGLVYPLEVAGAEQWVALPVRRDRGSGLNLQNWDQDLRD